MLLKRCCSISSPFRCPPSGRDAKRNWTPERLLPNGVGKWQHSGDWHRRGQRMSPLDSTPRRCNATAGPCHSVSAQRSPFKLTAFRQKGSGHNTAIVCLENKYARRVGGTGFATVQGGKSLGRYRHGHPVLTTYRRALNTARRGYSR